MLLPVCLTRDEIADHRETARGGMSWEEATCGDVEER